MSTPGHRLRAATCAAASAALLAACAGRGAPATVEPAVAAEAIERTAPDRPLRVIFDWELLDGEARFSGSGAARIAPPYRARLDLFGPRGEGYLSAALIDETLRLPAGTRPVPLPPPAMLWAALGVVAPPGEAVLSGTRTGEDGTELYYDVGSSALRYTLTNGRLQSVRWEGGDRDMFLQLRGSVEPGLPLESYFRDSSANMELKLSLEEVDEVESHPPEIWFPGA